MPTFYGRDFWRFAAISSLSMMDDSVGKSNAKNASSLSQRVFLLLRSLSIHLHYSIWASHPMNRIACLLAAGLVFMSFPNGEVYLSAQDSTGAQRDAGAAQSNLRKLLRTFRSEFVAISPGKGKFPGAFEMGRNQGPMPEQPQHNVRMAESFSIAKYETTQNLWQAVMGSNPSRWKGPRNSVEELSFEEAQQFCDKVTLMMRDAKLITESQSIRLPTEAEWEYCARAGTTTTYSHGNGVAELDKYAWHTGNAAGNDPPVGAKKPNPWGLYDMHGYLWEWCADPWHENYQDAPRTQAVWESNNEVKKRVLRSGSWKDNPTKLTSSFRIGLPPNTRDDAIGLRCVLSK